MRPGELEEKTIMHGRQNNKSLKGVSVEHSDQSPVSVTQICHLVATRDSYRSLQKQLEWEENGVMERITQNLKNNTNQTKTMDCGYCFHQKFFKALRVQKDV